jgi:predicted ArsR family transcriptional regulator
MTHPASRPATSKELRALARPLSWRIVRLCLDASWTNQQLAQRLATSPATTLRHVRALVKAGFLVAEAPRPGQRGGRERPYRATGRTWHLDLGQAGEPVLASRVELAAVDAHRAEMLEAPPHPAQHIRRGVLRLSPRSQRELAERIDALVDEFAARREPGQPLSFLWSLIARPD